MTGVEGGKDPWFCGVEVDALDSLGASKELALKREISVSLALLGTSLGSNGRFIRQTVGTEFCTFTSSLIVTLVFVWSGRLA
jgi:hypothetical protein